ncbi:neuronal tyrosine-phosphorylated phosphoinositide-3-kinase adapter 1 isoform X1 [Chiloscyllium plagiosum]|uniref:neuronal tyrosine-phosphorylated phosphoinositide-3-kinase adapter 1 isoform X1 n=1 Tax=Chiloscyllium plagiosum TaxID=36176 RepID=UPI001CB7D526|nr:neuronal tyrosine-phosphorylated phosphoinositide-3-kinase adapter 1 isoform X1 [Chiloscyllium plagiosum]XP_043542835.1 neuronal tyrosine-phosphorylated phosphoinositide-3-kinase adapter 1 isoform X1 [Chiloscyllium plagiosum]
MSSGLQDAAITSFLQFIEDKGFKVYTSLTKQSCDTGKVPRCLRDEMNLLYRKTKMEWKHREDESKKNVCKDGGLGRVRDLASFRKHFRMGFMTMPASQEHGPHPCASGMTTRSLSLHSVGSVENGEHSCTRKPPSKPRRHPSTKLSLCPEGRSSSGDEGLGSKGEKVMQRPGLEAGDSGRRIPPLKPKRSPNTQLSVSFDEASAGRASLPVTSGPRYTPPAEPPCGSEEEVAGEEEEPVYIEMVGDVFKEQSAADEDSDHSEAIYEEMKYPLPEDATREAKWSKFVFPKSSTSRGLSQAGPKAPYQADSRGSPHDIPPPFPNLLLHRPPLLAFPQSASQKAYKTPLALTVASQPGSKLPVLQHGDSAPTPGDAQSAGQPIPRVQKEDGLHQGVMVPSGRARSHSTPLPPQTSGQHRPEKELPTSHTMKALAQSALAGRQTHVYQKAERDKPPSLSVICSSVKVTTHSLVTQASGDQKVDKELSSVQSVFCSISKASTPSRPLSSLYKMPVAHGLLEHPSLPGPGSLVWPYLPLACKRPPAYDSLKPGSAQRVCPAVYHATVKTQGQDRAPAFTNICCPRSVTNPEARSPPGEASSGHGWQRNLPCSRKAQDPEGGAPGRSGTNESMDKEEIASAIPLKTQGAEGCTIKGPSRSGLPQPCPMTCQRSVDSALSHRLGRSASTSGVRYPLAHLQRQCSQSRDSPSQGLQQQALREKDGKLLEVIEHKRCLCKEIKARRRPERSLCKQDSMPILPSWKKGSDSRKTGTPPCQRQHTVLWDTAI